MTQFVITNHAVERYQKRISNASYNVAYAELTDLCRTARRAKMRTYQGQPLWAVGPEPPSVFLVCKSEDGYQVCVTVLTSDQVNIDDHSNPVFEEPEQPAAESLPVVVAPEPGFREVWQLKHEIRILHQRLAALEPQQLVIEAAKIQRMELQAAETKAARDEKTVRMEARAYRDAIFSRALKIVKAVAEGKDMVDEAKKFYEGLGGKLRSIVEGE